jgi:FlaA1/EpsC-like NDP-sugar epimerase
MNSVLITGGTGAFGQAFTQYLLKETNTQRIVVFSRGEFAQHLMSEKLSACSDRLRFMIGDVRDEDRLRHALQDVDTVVHAAALKRIEVEEYNPEELVQTNIDGTRNLIRAAHDAGVHKLILLSTDKAFQAVNLYGAGAVRSLRSAATAISGTRPARWYHAGGRPLGKASQSRSPIRNAPGSI